MISLVLVVVSACSSPSQNDSTLAPVKNASSSTPPADVVAATASEVQLRDGAEGEATVRLRIADGYHVNANPPSDKFYIGTLLTVTAQSGVEPGEPIYPAPVNKKFSFATKPLDVYENYAVIRLPLRASAGAAKGKHSLTGKVRVQPCNDEVCLPPREVPVTIAVTIN